jgi:DNA replicative helicase MCM subunit Mcm2 (Cdc46/Mcm family)
MHDDMRLGELLRAHPKIMLQLFERALDKIQDSILAQPVSGRLHKKKKLRVRIDALPQSSETMKGTLPRTSDINKLVAVRGTVIRTGAPKMLEVRVPCYTNDDGY